MNPWTSSQSHSPIRPPQLQLY